MDLQALYEKMGEFLQMDELLGMEEFSNYYKELTGFLQAEYQEQDAEGLIKLKAICAIVYQNAAARAKMDAKTRNKFRKMAEKCEFWANAIESRLLKEGYTPERQEEMEKALWQR